MKKILFVCTGNTCRSPMAEVIFNKICEERDLPYRSESAGTCTVSGIPMALNSQIVLKERGYETEEFTSTDISELNLGEYHLFAVMTTDHAESLVSFGVPPQKVYIMAYDKGGISDPYGMSEGVYRRCRNEITKETEKLIDFLEEKYGD